MIEIYCKAIRGSSDPRDINIVFDILPPEDLLMQIKEFVKDVENRYKFLPMTEYNMIAIEKEINNYINWINK